MSSPSPSSDEVADEGQGYADTRVESYASMVSSILGFAGEGNHEAETEDVIEEDVEVENDSSREWTNATPPPTIAGYGWAPHEVGLYAFSYVTSASLEYLVSRVSVLVRAKDVESILLTVCRSNERACHGREGHETDFFSMYIVHYSTTWASDFHL